MKYLINLIKIIFIYLIITIVFATFSYINIINDDTLTIIQLVGLLITIIIISYNMGKKKEKNGYLEGIKIGLICVITFIIINLLLNSTITPIKMIYYLLIILLSTLGSIIGINKKAKS